MPSTPMGRRHRRVSGTFDSLPVAL